MALASQIDQAARTQTPSVGSDDRLNSVHLVHVATGTPEEEIRELVRATRAVVRIAGDMVLAALGLPTAIPRRRP